MMRNPVDLGISYSFSDKSVSQPNGYVNHDDIIPLAYPNGVNQSISWNIICMLTVFSLEPKTLIFIIC